MARTYNMVAHRKSISEEDYEKFKKYWPVLTTRQLELRFGVSASCVARTAKRLGLPSKMELKRAKRAE